MNNYFTYKNILQVANCLLRILQLKLKIINNIKQKPLGKHVPGQSHSICTTETSLSDYQAHAWLHLSMLVWCQLFVNDDFILWPW